METRPIDDPPSRSRLLTVIGSACVLVLLAVGAVFALGPEGGRLPWINHDAAWLLRFSGDLGAETRLYIDRFEINPPSVFAFDRLVLAGAASLGLSPVAGFHLALIALAVGGVLGLWRHAKHARHGGVGLLTIPAFTLIALTWGSQHFGQRPHLFALVFLPYVLIRLGDAPDRGRLATLLAFGAGWLACMKPQYLALLVVLEVAVLGRTRRGSPGPWSALVVGAAFPVAFVEWISPGSFAHYVQEIVPSLLSESAYAALDRDWDALLQSPWAARSLILVGGATLVAGAARLGGQDGWRVLASVALPVAALAGALSQSKFYGYHFLPLVGLSVVLMASLVEAWGQRGPHPSHAEDGERHRPAPGASGLTRVLAIAALVAVAIAGYRLARTAREGLPRSERLAAFLDGHATALVLSSTVSAELEAAACEEWIELVGRWGDQRIRVHLILAAKDGDRTAAEADYRAQVSEEIRELSPDLVFISRSRSPALGRPLAEVLGAEHATQVLPTYDLLSHDQVDAAGQRMRIFDVYRRRR